MLFVSRLLTHIYIYTFTMLSYSNTVKYLSNYSIPRHIQDRLYAVYEDFSNDTLYFCCVLQSNSSMNFVFLYDSTAILKYSLKMRSQTDILLYVTAVLNCISF